MEESEVGRGSGFRESFLFFVDSGHKGDSPAKPEATHEVDSRERSGVVMEEEAMLTLVERTGKKLSMNLSKVEKLQIGE